MFDRIHDWLLDRETVLIIAVRSKCGHKIGWNNKDV